MIMIMMKNLVAMMVKLNMLVMVIVIILIDELVVMKL